MALCKSLTTGCRIIPSTSSFLMSCRFANSSQAFSPIKVTNGSCRIFFLRQQHTKTNAAESRCRVQCKLFTYQHLYRYVVHRGVFLGSIQECIHICMIPSHWHISGSRLVATDHTRWCLRRQYRHSIGSHANTRIVCSFYRWECTFAYNRHYCTCMRYLKQKIDIYEITSLIYVQRYRKHKIQQFFISITKVFVLISIFFSSSLHY